uniref:Complement component C7 n=1 Tax=Neogobius melanostomus TaxID=47308 RepID=A0A8C6WPJ5_9GOBI
MKLRGVVSLLDSAAVLTVWLLLLSPARGEVPVNCRWSDFGPWSECDPCSGTKVRTRRIAVFAQFGGALCSGDSSESQPCSSHKHCPLQDGCGGRFRCSSGLCISRSLVCNGDQDCEDGLDERGCEDTHYSCNTQRTPPNSALTGRGYNALTGELKASVLNTQSFGGQCRKVYNAESNSYYRLPNNVLNYDLQVTVNNEESDESFESSWSYMQHVQTKALFTNYKHTFHQELSENKAHRVIILKNRVLLGQFQTSAPAYLSLSESFWRALAALPHTYDYASYRQLLHTYGTHYLSGGAVGGEYTALLQLTKHAMESTSTTDIEYQRCWKKVKRRLFRKKVTVKCERLTQALSSNDAAPSVRAGEGGAVLRSEEVVSAPGPGAVPLRAGPLSMQTLSQQRCPCALRGPVHLLVPTRDVRGCLRERGCHRRTAWSGARRLELLVAMETCSGGHKSRSRSCTNPAPSRGGAQCLGLGVERQPCEEPDLQYLRLMEPQCLGLSVPPPKTCPSPPPLSNGFVRNAKDVYLVGDRVEFSCIHGYHLQGGALSTCSEQQTWSAGSRRCEASLCAAPVLRANVKATPVKAAYEMGESVSLSCPPGHVLDRDVSQSVCSSSLQWSPAPEEMRCKLAPTDLPLPSGLLCAPWESVGRRGCVCKMPAQCQPSLRLCADLGFLKRTLGVCQLGALRCLGRGLTLLSDEQCAWEEPSCGDCEPGTKCDESSNKCICQKVSDCPPGSALLCARYGNSNVNAAISECEVGARRCAGESVNVIAIDACPDQ